MFHNELTCSMKSEVIRSELEDLFPKYLSHLCYNLKISLRKPIYHSHTAKLAVDINFQLYRTYGVSIKICTNKHPKSSFNFLCDFNTFKNVTITSYPR